MLSVRNKIQKQTEEFLKAGNKITVLPPSKTSTKNKVLVNKSSIYHTGKYRFGTPTFSPLYGEAK